MAVKQSVALIEYRSLDIPFRHVFRHASAARDKTATLWVTATGVDGLIGHGEGCPREYVTGESIAGAAGFIERHRQSLSASVIDVNSIKTWMMRHVEEIEHNPAAWCALELALLDLLSRQSGVSVENYLGLPSLGQTFNYTAVVGVTSAEQCAAIVAQDKNLGMTDFKIKLSGDLPVDRRNIEILNAAQPKRIRADANNLWADVEAACDYLVRLQYSFFAIEEPFSAGRFDLMEALNIAVNAPIILDESILRVDQLNHLAKDPNRWIVNVRVSKMGGLLRSLDVIDQCRVSGVPIIIGAQVGETSLLTRAALTLANSAQEILIAQEGAFGTYLLESDPCEPELKFTGKGELNIEKYRLADRPGFGLDLVD